jgi:hypothetical protein
MKPSRPLLTLIPLLAMLMVVCFPSTARAQDDNYTMLKWTVSAGGGNSSLIRLSLTGTIGQPIAGTPARGGRFEVNGGFWRGARAAPPEIYLPVIVSPPPERPFPRPNQESMNFDKEQPETSASTGDVR